MLLVRCEARSVTYVFDWPAGMEKGDILKTMHTGRNEALKCLRDTARIKPFPRSKERCKLVQKAFDRGDPVLVEAVKHAIHEVSENLAPLRNTAYCTCRCATCM